MERFKTKSSQVKTKRKKPLTFEQRSKASKKGWRKRKARERQERKTALLLQGLRTERQRKKVIKSLPAARPKTKKGKETAKARDKRIAKLEKELEEARAETRRVKRDADATLKQQEAAQAQQEKAAGKLLTTMIGGRQEAERNLAEHLGAERERKAIEEKAKEWPSHKGQHFIKQDGTIGIRPSVIRTYDDETQESILESLNPFSDKWGGTDSPSEFREQAEALAAEYGIDDVREIYDFFYSP